MRILIKNTSYILTVDAERRIIRDGAVVVGDNGRIEFVGKMSQLKPSSSEHTIDAKGKIVAPGFIDCHTHQMQQFARGLTSFDDAFNALFNVIYPLETNLTSEDAYWSALLAQTEMIRHGTTCYMDPGSAFPEEMAKATGDSGIRGVVSRHTWDIPSTSLGTVSKGISESTNEAVSKAEDTVKRLNGLHQGRVRAGFSLRVLLGCSDQLCKEIKGLADRYNTTLITHASLTLSEVESSRSRFGNTEILRLEKLGVLGPNLCLIHMGYVTHEEIPLLKKYDVKVIIDPAAGMKFGSGNMSHGRFPEMMRMGVNVCLSTDAAAWTTFDHVRQMQLFTSCLREARLDATVTSPEMALELATINGARTAGWSEEVGSIEVGKRADLIVLDCNRPEWRPLFNPISNLVFCANGDSVETVIANGKLLMENRRILTVDEAKVLEEGQKRAEAVAERAGIADYAKGEWPVV